MAKNKLSDLRDHLFETLEGVKDGTMEPERAKVITQVAGTIIDTARVELKFLELVGDAEDASPFFPATARTPKRLNALS